MDKIDNIIEKALYLGGFKTKKNLAKWLGIDASAINQWKKSGNIPKNHLKKIENIISADTSSSVINGNNNMAINGIGNSISNSKIYKKSPEIEEISELLQEYASSKFLKDLKEKLLKIKELHE